MREPTGIGFPGGIPVITVKGPDQKTPSSLLQRNACGLASPLRRSPRRLQCAVFYYSKKMNS
jgi:hypothetical protein